MAVLGILVIASLLFLYYIKSSKEKSRIYVLTEKNFEGPTPVPFLGNALNFPTSSAGITETLIKYAKQYERCYRLWLGSFPAVLLYDPRDVEALLGSNTHITKSPAYRFTIPWIGLGLLTSKGAKWKSRRKILTPTFHFKILDDFVEIFEKNGTILIQRLREQTNKPAFDIYTYANLYALDNICETAMGVSVHAQKDSNSKYVTAIKSMCNIVNMRSFRPWLMPDALFNLSNYGPIQKNALAILHKTTKDTILSRRQDIRRRRQRQEAKPDENEELNGRRKLAFLDLLLESAEASKLSDSDIQEEVDTFMFEGHDTISSAIAFTLYCLSQNPGIQEKVLHEQREIFGDSNRSATYKDYQDMKYLERVIKEAQRLYPSVPVIGRKIEEDLPLHGGKILPKGCQAFIFMPQLHMDPKIWPNPNDFDPDRFIPENSAKRSPYAHVPFSAGPRNCIGQRFAYMELKSCVSKVVKNFRILPCSKDQEPKLTAEMIFISSNGINIRLEERPQEENLID